jgi:hypothetical protein
VKKLQLKRGIKFDRKKTWGWKCKKNQFKKLSQIKQLAFKRMRSNLKYEKNWKVAKLKKNSNFINYSK